MNPFLDTPQIEELTEFNYWDDEETKFEVEDYYDDLASGIPFDSSYDFWWHLTLWTLMVILQQFWDLLE